MGNQKSIHVAPFPALAWDSYSWSGKDILPAWAGFQAREGSYSSLSNDAPSTGRATINVAPIGNPAPSEAPPALPPAPEQVAAYAYLKENDRAILAVAVRAIFDVYAEWQGRYMFDDEKQAEVMPDLATPDDLRRLIGLGTVHVLNVAKDGYAYVGLELGCTWDEEHGTGILLHKDRVIDLGAADASFIDWPALDDGGTELEVP
ncbi:MAG: hypothetical protein ACAI43_14290 [Phycisphaerae bacterium]